MRRSTGSARNRLVVGLTATALAFASPLLAKTEVASAAATEASAFRLDFSPRVDHDGATLTVAGPDHFYLRQAFAVGDAISLSPEADGVALADGQYAWELTFAPRLSAAARKALERARATGDEAPLRELRDSGALPASDMTASGFFRVRQGAFVLDDAEPPSAGRSGVVRKSQPGIVRVTSADQVIPDDLIVQGSICTGFDCVNNESFGFDTIKLKENNLRIKFEDTSVGTFPSNDWQLTANDSASGGASKFSIDDVTGGRTPFTTTAGAATNSLFIDSIGRIGLRTSTPVLDLHINTNNTPAIRLEQNNTGGFTAQTWDVGANEANFFVRDVTGGSLLSLRIRPGAPTSSVDISSDGDVGIGTGSPDAQLHVLTTDIVARGDGVLHVSNENTGAPLQRVMIVAENRGAPQTEMRDTSNGITWRVGMNTPGDFVINDTADTPNPEFRVETDGDVFVNGVLVHSSSRTLKEGFADVDGTDVLERLRQVPITRWSFLQDAEKTPHIGPMAEDFHAAFNVGSDDRHIALNDSIGVALASVQGLLELLDAKDAEMEALEARIAALEALLQENGAR